MGGFKRKKVRAVDPNCQDRKKVEAYKAKFSPKNFNLAPKADDSDVEDFIPHNSKVARQMMAIAEAKQSRHQKREKLAAKKRKSTGGADGLDGLDDSSGLPDGPATKKKKVAGDASAEKLEMPKLQEGESFRNFKRRLDKVKAAIFTNRTADAASRQNQCSQINPKRKQRLAERAAASKLKKQMKRERSPDRESSSAASASSSSSSASGANVRFGEVVQAPPKISAVPKLKQRLNITDLQRKESEHKEHVETAGSGLSEEAERALFVKRTAARQLELQRERAILAYKNAKISRNKVAFAARADSIARTGAPAERDRRLPFGNL